MLPCAFYVCDEAKFEQAFLDHIDTTIVNLINPNSWSCDFNGFLLRLEDYFVDLFLFFAELSVHRNRASNVGFVVPVFRTYIHEQ